MLSAFFQTFTFLTVTPAVRRRMSSNATACCDASAHQNALRSRLCALYRVRARAVRLRLRLHPPCGRAGCDARRRYSAGAESRDATPHVQCHLSWMNQRVVRQSKLRSPSSSHTTKASQGPATLQEALRPLAASSGCGTRLRVRRQQPPREPAAVKDCARLAAACHALRRPPRACGAHAPGAPSVRPHCWAEAVAAHAEA